MTYRQTHGYNYTSNYTYTYSFFILFITINVVHIGTKYCRSCPQQTKRLSRPDVDEFLSPKLWIFFLFLKERSSYNTGGSSVLLNYWVWRSGLSVKRSRVYCRILTCICFIFFYGTKIHRIWIWPWIIRININTPLQVPGIEMKVFGDSFMWVQAFYVSYCCHVVTYISK
jgi:hypothetical protein